MGNICSCLQKEVVNPPELVAVETMVREGRFPPNSPLRTDKPDVDTDFSEEVKDLIVITGVKFDVNDDTVTHHTLKYDLTDRRQGKDGLLVVRRGQPFQMTITCDRPYDPEKDDIKLIFQTGDHPHPTKGTLEEMILSDVDLPKQWGAKLVRRTNNDLQLQVMTPPFCPVGRWNVKVRAVKKGETPSISKVYSHPQPIYILFNPWCKDDQVYLHDDKLLEEYVLNDTGKIFVGSVEYINGRAWSFAQFEDPVLDCVLDLLDQKGFPASSRGDPIKVVRKLTALVSHSLQ
ncbi:hemocyte protein-glutamine gamma-glutamyltransferase-like, partial [Pecten maximus]|uniref:hemocyte protein-glutamine gamma-glutamyltransferase-like n=1 Tax=Pecten maximus TaxID=6579 RepID=UPI001457F792